MRARGIGAVALLVLGTLLWITFGLGVWAKRQALDTDNWVDTSGQLLENEDIRNALGLFIADRLFQRAEIQDRIEEALPDQFDPLAGPAAAGLKQVAQREAPRLLGTAAALGAWEKANEVAHSELLDIVEGRLAQGGVSLDLKTLFQQIASGVGLPDDAVDRLPPEVANLQVASPDDVDEARDLLDLFQTLVWVLLALAIAAFAGAIALAPDRRGTVVKVGGCLIFAAIAGLAIRRLAGNLLVDALADAPNAQDAADDAWAIATSLQVDAAQGSFLVGLFLVVGAWLAGAGRRATAVRRFSAHALHERRGLVRAGLGLALLLLVIWGPVPWTQRVWPMVILTLGSFAWLEWIRHRTLAEFPDEPPPRVSLPWRRPAPGRPA